MNHPAGFSFRLIDKYTVAVTIAPETFKMDMPALIQGIATLTQQEEMYPGTATDILNLYLDALEALDKA